MVASDDELDINYDVDEQDIADAVGSVTPSAAFEALKTSLGWLETQNLDPEHLLIVKKCRHQGERLRNDSLNQSIIT